MSEATLTLRMIITLTMMTTIMTLRRKRQSPEATPSCFRRLDLWSKCRNALHKSQLMRIIVLIMMIVLVVHNICHICHVFTRAWALTVRVWHKVEFYCTLDMWHSDIISWITPPPPTPPPPVPCPSRLRTACVRCHLPHKNCSWVSLNFFDPLLYNNGK